jgi:cytoskeletal protein RodZ
MEREQLGGFLRRLREDRGLGLTELSAATRIPRASLEALEDGRLEDLPGDVFVRGFVRCYARAVGVSDVEPMALYDRAVQAARRAAAAAEAAAEVPVPLPGLEDDASSSRRGVGLAVFVIILLLIATITLSLLLRQPPRSGEGVSLRAHPAASVLAPARPVSSGRTQAGPRGA